MSRTRTDADSISHSPDSERPFPTGCRFDSYAQDYDEVLNRALAVTGEDASFFARGRIAWLALWLGRIRERPRSVLDYGCGRGSSTPLFLELLGAESVLGVDSSRALLDRATQAYGSGKARFLHRDEYHPDGQMDLVFCNGVFHHIPAGERGNVAAGIFRALRPGGLLALWENNPWNPATRYVMSRIPFDSDAQTLEPPDARRLLHGVGFEILRTDFLFLFPRFLRWLRALEPVLSRFPFGAQYQVLSRKPG